MNNERHTPIGFWIGIVLGGLIGAATIILMSTKEGRKLAKEWWKKLEVILDEWEGQLKEVEQQAKVKKEEVIEKLTEVKDQMVDTVHQQVHKVAGLPEPSKEESLADTPRFFKKNGEPLG